MRNRDFIVLISINFQLIIIDFYWFPSNYIDFSNFSKHMDQPMDGWIDTASKFFSVN